MTGRTGPTCWTTRAWSAATSAPASGPPRPPPRAWPSSSSSPCATPPRATRSRAPGCTCGTATATATTTYLYSQGVTGENYLRGAQEADAGGTVTFTSIFPACYAGRWPHIHFEVYASLSDTTSSGPIVKTSQIALPKEACEAVYATSGYEQSITNLSQVSLTGDNVFGDDGGIHQIATMSGDAAGGYSALLTIGV